MVYQQGPKLMTPLPSRPLTRVMARARSPSNGGKHSSPSSGTETGNNKGSAAGSKEHMQDAYRMEVNEYMVRPGSPTGSLVGPAIPCVTVRDMHTFIPDKKQRRVWIPVAVCEELSKVLKQCRVQEGETKATYDVSKLAEQNFQCPVTKKMCEIERVEDSTRLRTYMDVSKESSQNGGFVEVIELRNELMSRLIKFLDDVATRYRRINTQMVIPSLYSYSGERRFYYDLRETRWGLRLHISQVTDMHRNVIGIPLEAVVAFRDRLNQAIDFLGLEDENSKQQSSEEAKGGRNSAKGGRRQGSATKESNTRKGRNNRRQGRRRSKSQKDAASGDNKKAEEGQDASSEVEAETAQKRESDEKVESEEPPKVDEVKKEESEPKEVKDSEEKAEINV